VNAAMRRRLSTIEGRFPPQEAGLTITDHVAMLKALSDEQLDILEGLVERRDAWPGDVEDWMANDLSVEDRQHLFEITTTINEVVRASTDP
jgi:hypothetical protein